MAIRDADVWHQVHAQREDGVAAMFLIRDIEPRADQPKIFVVELPYAVTDLSGQPDAAGYRRLGAFQEQWLEPACAALGWTFVAWKSEDGSFFLYLYGAGDPEALLEKLAPFDGELGFFNDLDADWSEYAALRELVEQAEAEAEAEAAGDSGHVHTDDCGHNHNHNHHHHPDHRREATQGIEVIDLTGERPADAAPDEGDGERDDEGDDKGNDKGNDGRNNERNNERDEPASAIRSATARLTKRAAAASKPTRRAAAGKPTKRTAASKPAKRAAASKPAKRTAASKPAKRAAAGKPAKRTAKPSKPATKSRSKRTRTRR